MDSTVGVNRRYFANLISHYSKCVRFKCIDKSLQSHYF